MPATKRNRRAVDDDDGGETVETQSATSNFRQESGRKRVRISDVGAGKQRASREESLSESEESEVPDDDDGEVTNSPPKTQYEVIRDQDHRHLAHEAQDDLRARMKVEAYFSQDVAVGSENREAENGVIESVTCINFMCHTKLVVEFGPLINFVVGENGSGKSAVLTALSLCLGAKPSSTNRGGSLKDHIKEGTDNSIIRVQIKNQGDTAYQHDVFGDSIIVERSFNRNGSTGYKLKGVSNNRIVSTKKRDVDEMTEYFCLQMDNPLNVLSQDNARQFLNSSSPALKYKYFVQGVQLEALDNDYKMVMEMAENAELKLPAAEEHIGVLKQRADETDQDLRTLQENQQLKTQQRLYRHQLMWAQVVDKERVVQECEQKIAMMTEKAATEATKVAQLEQLKNAQDDKIKDTEQDVKYLEEELDAAKGSSSAKKDEFNEAMAELKQHRQDHRRGHLALNNANEEVASLQRQIREEESRLSEGTGENKARKTRELEKAKERVCQIDDQAKENKARADQLHQALKNAEESCESQRRAVNKKAAEVQALESQARDAKKSSPSECSGLDPQTNRLLDLIDQHREFDQKPIGPLGRLIRLRKPEWVVPVEQHIGQSAFAYIVASQKDSQQLRELAKKAGVRNVSTLISSGKRLDLGGKEPGDQYETILRLLEFDNDLVRDQLIIHHHIEQVLLMSDRTEAMKVLFDQKPHRLAYAYCRHDKNKNEFHSLTLAGRKTDPCRPPPNFRPRLRTDNVAQARHLEERLSDQKAELRELKKRLEVANKKRSDAASDLKGNTDQKALLARDKRLASAAVTSIEGELDQYANEDSHLNMLKEQLQVAEGNLNHEVKQMAQIGSAKDDLNKQVEGLKKETTTEGMKVKRAEEKVKACREKLDKQKEARAAQLTEVNKAHAAKDTAEIVKGDLRKERDKHQQHAEDLARQATEAGSTRVHIPETETTETISAKYTALGQKLRRLQERLGATEAEVIEKAVTSKKAYRSARDQLQTQKNLQVLLNNSLEDRLSRWRQFQRLLSARTRVSFAHLLSERGMRGNMRIDHKAKKLSLLVEPDETQKNAKGRQTKTLSGGEKSYASICMLLAIWDAMGSSIRCLDEFDVFMDNVNRTIATNMLISAARRSVTRQYILITPNAIEGRVAELATDVKIIRLCDPRQMRLDSMRT